MKANVLLLALTALALAADPLAAQSHSQPEPIGKGGSPVPTTTYGASQRGSPFYVAPPPSTYGRGYTYPVRPRPKPAPKR